MTFYAPFLEVAVVLSVAAVLGAIALWLRQPLIIAFIVAGMLLGPAGFHWVHARDQVDLFAKLGIELLLFAAGLSLGMVVAFLALCLATAYVGPAGPTGWPAIPSLIPC